MFRCIEHIGIYLFLSCLVLVENLSLFCKHLNFQDDELNVKVVIGAFLNLMEDPDKVVRVAFSSHIKHILGSSENEEGFIKEVKVLGISYPFFKKKSQLFQNVITTMNVIISNLAFQLFVSKMKEAYTNAKMSRNNELKDTLILTTGDIGRYLSSSAGFNSFKFFSSARSYM